jgi:aspartate ammonia-lyase
MRTEKDLLGEIKVHGEALYGAQTQRAVENFPLHGQKTIGDFPDLIQGLIRVKQAATRANAEAGELDESIGDAVLAACDTVLDQEMWDQFPVHTLHGGGGTSANMNANEVLANVAEESLGGRRGEYLRVHPNDHVNLNQSTNDVYPTACHVAVILRWKTLNKSTTHLARCLTEKGEALCDHLRLARTCLQDAVPIGFDEWLSGYVSLITRCEQRIGHAVADLHHVNLGGTIVGRRGDVPATYYNRVISSLCDVTGDPDYVRADNLFDAAQNPDDLVNVSQQLDLLASGIVKLCKDLRLLCSGPEAGIGEVLLPVVQPGSSAMPGKVNPVIPEFAIQLCLKARGLHSGCRMALEHGELDLNVWESGIIFGILESMDLLQCASDSLSERCVKGLQVLEERNLQNVGTIIPEITRLSKQFGYSRVSKICSEANGDFNLLRQLLKAGFPDSDQVQQ